MINPRLIASHPQVSILCSAPESPPVYESADHNAGQTEALRVVAPMNSLTLNREMAPNPEQKVQDIPLPRLNRAINNDASRDLAESRTADPGHIAAQTREEMRLREELTQQAL